MEPLVEIGLPVLAAMATSATVTTTLHYRRWTRMFGKQRAKDMMRESLPFMRPVFRLIWRDASGVASS